MIFNRGKRSDFLIPLFLKKCLGGTYLFATLIVSPKSHASEAANASGAAKCGVSAEPFGSAPTSLVLKATKCWGLEGASPLKLIILASVCNIKR